VSDQPNWAPGSDSEAYNLLDEMVGNGQFSLTKDVSDQLHGLVARHEAIESGSLRGEGRV
jgi:hypothetical protein